jgi:alginate O-acetyltransferase complex protein AlgI
VERIACLALGTLLVALTYRLWAPPEWRGRLLLAASLAFIASLGVVHALFAAFTVALVVVVVRRIESAPEGAPVAVRLLIAWLVGSLLVFKLAEAGFLRLPGGAGDPGGAPGAGVALPGGLLPLGASYLVFRAIHYVVDVAKRRLAPGTPAEFATYALFFPAFLAGPVERFGRFREQARAADRFDLADLNHGVARVLLGAFKKVVIADALPAWVLPVLDAPGAHAAPVVLLAVYGLALQIYMDFSGYTDIALGAARLFGFRLQENFQRPFLQPSIARFWRSWHISVSMFIRDYVFYPLFARRPRRWKTLAGVMFTMVLFMLWHRLSASFLLLGLVHGTALVLWQLLQDFKARRPGLRALLAARAMAPVCVLATVTFVSFTFLLFRYDLRHVGALLGRLLSR